MIESPVDALIDELFARPADRGESHALVASRSGEIIAERYGVKAANGFEPEVAVDDDTTLISWSMAKSMPHAAVGVLVADGVLSLDAPAPVPEWADDARAAITLLDLLEMRSGLRFVEDYVDGEVSHCIEMLFGGTDPSHGHYAASQPLDHEPGSVFNYSSGTTNIICRIIGDVVTRSTGGVPAERSAAVGAFLSDRLFEPAGMSAAIPKFDDAGDFVGSSFVYATARDFVKFGEFYLRDGVSEAGTRVLPEGWMEHARQQSGYDDGAGLGYGRHWWLWPAFPGSLACHGYDGQFIVVIPDDDLVIAHLGKTSAAYNQPLQMWLARVAERL
ncbi:MAG: serine hydrolase domain-containing protein [Ilumatobacter sp.]